MGVGDVANMEGYNTLESLGFRAYFDAWQVGVIATVGGVGVCVVGGFLA